MKRATSSWKLWALMVGIMVIGAMALGLSGGGQHYPGGIVGLYEPGQNIYLDNNYSVFGKETGGTARAMLTMTTSDNTRLNTGPGKDIIFTVYGAEMMRLTSVGNLVLNNNHSVYGKDTGGTARALLTLTNTNDTRLNTGPGEDIIFTVGGTEKARIVSDGKVGIGTTTPDSNSQLTVDSALTNTIYGNNTGGGRGVYGNSSSGNGVYGTSSSGNGVYGSSSNFGVYGANSGSGNSGYLGGIAYGVYGNSGSGYGVSGNSVNSTGVNGSSTNGVGVNGASINSYAGWFDGKVKVDGSFATAYTSKTTSYAATASDSVIAVNATGGPCTIYLPTAVGCDGRVYTIKKIDSSGNGVTVDGNGAETIDGATTYYLSAQWKYVTVVSNGAGWLVVGNN